MSKGVNLQAALTRVKVFSPTLTPDQVASVIYHDVFDYPLGATGLFKWRAGRKTRRIKSVSSRKDIKSKSGFYFLKGREKLVAKRLIRKKASEAKAIKARKIGELLHFIPTIKMVAITGALAMENAEEESDIDLMIITKKGTLWASRLLTLFLVDLFGIPRRKYGEKEQKDKLCLNIWLDEADLEWDVKSQNIFTAHEIAQVLPLINKEGTYERFLSKNSWVKDYWPNATRAAGDIKILRYQDTKKKNLFIYLIPQYLSILASFIEPLAFWFQYQHMKRKITRETITPTRALFHPVDWGSFVLSRLARA